MRTKFAILLAIAVVCVTTAWADWPAEYQITNTTDSSNTCYGTGHKVVFAASGVGHLVWVTHNAQNVYALHYKRYYPATGLWTADTVLSSMGTSTNVLPHASIALDANGTDIHVVWTGQNHVKQCYYHVYYKKCVPSASGNGGWIGTPIDLCTDHTTYAHVDPAVACAPGRVEVTWYDIDEDGRGVGFREFAANKWQNQIQLETIGTYYRSLASISAAANGDVFVAYDGTQAGQSNTHVYVFRRIGGVWQAREDATAGLPNLNYVYTDIDFNPISNHPHIVCHGYDAGMIFRIYHTFRSAAGWQTPEVIPGADGDTSIQPNMCIGGDGKTHVVWYQYSADPAAQVGIEYSVCASEGGAWSTSWLTTSTARTPWPNVTVSSTGAGFAVWTKTSGAGAWQVWGRTLPVGGFGPQATGTTVIPHGLALDVSPNPVSRRMVVNYTLPAAGNVSLKLYDVRGALAKTVACGNVLPGSHAVSLDRQGLVRGAYIMKLESGSGSLTRKFVIE